jgi:hypothetical protein
VLAGGDYDRWDLEVRRGLFDSIRICMALEDHGSGAQLIRFRVWPRFALLGLLLTLLLVIVAIMAAIDQEWLTSIVLGAGATALAMRMIGDFSVAMASLLCSLEQFGPTEVR